jgi:hypothetical protein
MTVTLTEAEIVANADAALAAGDVAILRYVEHFFPLAKNGRGMTDTVLACEHGQNVCRPCSESRFSIFPDGTLRVKRNGYEVKVEHLRAVALKEVRKAPSAKKNASVVASVRHQLLDVHLGSKTAADWRRVYAISVALGYTFPADLPISAADCVTLREGANETAVARRAAAVTFA